MMTKNAKRARRTRVIGIIASLYTLGMLVTLIALRPSEPAYWGDDAPPGLMLATAHDALEGHPFGSLMVPYEHRDLERMVRRGLTDSRDLRDISSTVYVYSLVLGEMTWLLVAMLGFGLIGALLAVKAGPMSTIWSGVLLLLAFPAPIASVGPGSIALTAPLLLFGILVLVMRPRAERPAPVAAAGAGAAGVDGVAPVTAISGPATTHPGREIAIGIGLIVLGIVVGALAAGMGGSRVAKVWIGAAAALGMGIWLLVSGLIHLGKKPGP